MKPHGVEFLANPSMGAKVCKYLIIRGLHHSTITKLAMKVLIFLMLLLPTQTALPQSDSPTDAKPQRREYVRFMTGVAMGPIMTYRCVPDVHNVGIRIFGEYNRFFENRWLLGASLDGMIPATGRLMPLLKNISLTAHRRVQISESNLYFLTGVGIGGNVIFLENEPIRVGPTVSFNFSMLWRVSPNAFLEFSPLLFLPTRVNAPLSDMFTHYHPHSFAFTFGFPSIGIKVAL